MVKACSDCGVNKPLEAFNLNPKGRLGRYSKCKDCQRAYYRSYYRGDAARHLAVQRTYRLQHREERAARQAAAYQAAKLADPEGLRREKRRVWIWSRYRLTLQEYDDLLAAQGGACAICLTVPAVFCVDHDHASGAVRGLLCRRCNALLGHAREDQAALERAIAYLGRNRQASN